MNFLHRSCEFFTSRININFSLTNNWRETKVGALFSSSPDVIRNASMLEYMENPPKYTMFYAAVFVVWIRFSISVLI